MALVIRVEEKDDDILEELERSFCVNFVTQKEYTKYEAQLLEENDIIIIED